MKQQRVIITGGIGAGKSVVSRVCRLEGIPVYDCDARASSIMNNDGAVREALIEICGTEIFNSDGLNKSVMGSLLFSDVELRIRVNAIVHEAVRRDIDKWCTTHSDSPIVMIESAIAATAGLTENADSIWLVEAPLEVRIKRVEVRNSLPRDVIKKRIEAQRAEYDQLPEDKTIRFFNDGITPLLPQINETLSALQELNS